MRAKARIRLRFAGLDVSSVPGIMSLDNGLVNLAAIIGTIVMLCGTIPLILIVSTPKRKGGDGKGT